MTSFLTYLDWRGDLPFSRDPVNEIDLLIFSELAYADMDDLFGKDQTLTLPDMVQRYLDAGIDQSSLIYDPKALMLKASECERYRNVLITGYVNHVDGATKTQFCATTFKIGSRDAVVAFRGTDNTVIGWREDFNFASERETFSQALAVGYLDRCDSQNIWVCGHSKGGNLAMYAAAFCSPAAREKIISISSFDGPGFLKEVLETENYNSILPRATLYLPDTSFFGLIMNQKAQRVIVRSSEMGFLQHNPYSWKVKQNHFERTNRLNPLSKYLDEVIDTWLEGISIEERRNFIDTIFNAIESTGISTFNEMQKRKFETLNAIIKALQKSDSAEIKGLLEILGKLAGTSGNVLLNDVKNFFGFGKDKNETEASENDEQH